MGENLFSFFFCILDIIVTKNAYGSVNLFSNHILLFVYGVCGHFVGVEHSLQGI